jgi:DNA-directed RNA polymerase specialized sigma24 family protein
MRRYVELVEGNISDGGVYSTRVEQKILEHELLAVMSPQERCVAMLRHHFDCDWHKIADILGTTVNAAQKSLSIGHRKAREACRRDSDKQSDIKKYKKRRKHK